MPVPALVFFENTLRAMQNQARTWRAFAGNTARVSRCKLRHRDALATQDAFSARPDNEGLSGPVNRTSS